jgi:hypothetical protein
MLGCLRHWVFEYSSLWINSKPPQNLETLGCKAREINGKAMEGHMGGMKAAGDILRH